MRPAFDRLLPVLLVLIIAPAVVAGEPLHEAIDRLILAAAKDTPVAAPADDAEFLRRVTLDFTGTIPTPARVRAFLDDSSPNKRSALLDDLLAAPTYAPRMAEVFHLMLMERLGDHPGWAKYLQTAFEKNLPWDVMARDMLRGVPSDESTQGAVFFYSKRLENYGQNAVDYSGLTRDVGRLFLGMNLQCAECHDHLFVKDYKQADFQGLFAFYKNTALVDAALPAITEKPTMAKLEFQSVFKKEPKLTGPRVPKLAEIAIPDLPKGAEYKEKPDPKTKKPGVLAFSPLEKLAEQLPTADNPAFVRNAVNRLWFILMGRGLVHPLDMHHLSNPPSHPELMDRLAQEFVEHRFDIRYLLREIALSKTYQRSSLYPEGRGQPPPEKFLVALERRLSAEQLMRSMLTATGEPEPKDAARTALLAKFTKAFANPPREPEEEIAPSLRAALFVLNDPVVLGWLQPKDGNLVGRVAAMTDPAAMADELYVSVLSRRPTPDEASAFVEFLKKHTDRRSHAVSQFAWALLASTEFGVNH